jgi:hypothetical protein
VRGADEKETKTKIMKNIPSKIFLQIGEDVDNQDDFRDLEEVTWCEDMILDTDIEYTRHIASYSELVKAICWLRDQHFEAYQEALGLHGKHLSPRKYCD